jgi:glycosyltransferase involved in cell wall biosynthesis
MVKACEEEGVPCVILEYGQMDRRKPITSWLDYKKWRRLLRELKPDVIHANDPYGVRSVMLSAWREGVPVVCHIHFPPKSQFIAWAFRYLPKPNWFIINSRAVEREVGPPLRRACPHAGQTVIYNAVELDVFRPQSNGNHKPPRIGIVANLLPIKGHMDFLMMVRELTQRKVEGDYWIIGEDIHNTGYKRALMDRAEELGLQQKIQFLGYCDNVAQLLSRLDIVVSCSHAEPFGISLIEAMACQKPVVAPRVGGIPEVVEDKVTGLLVSPHAPIELANAVERLILEPELCKRMGQAGRRRVERLFSPQSHVDQTLSIYKTLSRC